MAKRFEAPKGASGAEPAQRGSVLPAIPKDSGPPTTAIVTFTPSRPSAATVETLARKLVASSDRMNELFRLAVLSFQRSGLTIRGEIVLEECEEPTGEPFDRVLFYGKEGGTWDLYVARRFDQGEWYNHVDTAPVTKVSRELRVLAAKKMPELYSQLESHLEATCTEVGQAVDALEAVLANVPQVIADRQAERPNFMRPGNRFQPPEPPGFPFEDESPSAPVEDDGIPF